jgi:hypothetical protein
MTVLASCHPCGISSSCSRRYTSSARNAPREDKKSEIGDIHDDFEAEVDLSTCSFKDIVRMEELAIQIYHRLGRRRLKLPYCLAIQSLHNPFLCSRPVYPAQGLQNDQYVSWLRCRINLSIAKITSTSPLRPLPVFLSLLESLAASNRIDEH